MRTRTLKSFSIALLAMAALPLLAVEVKPYDAGAVQSAVKEGKTVVLDFHAPWCGTCRKQSKIFEDLDGMKDLENSVVFKVDYDKAKDLRKEYSVKKQSTLVRLGAKGETGRLLGETNKDAIHAFLKGSAE